MSTELNSHMPVKVGETIRRSELQAVIGGSNQQGMTSCLNGTEFILFHNPEASKDFGYDKWEGVQVDDSFLFTGQGVSGDQKMARGNKGIVEFSREGKPIHLFESLGTSTTYLGQVTLRSLIPETRRALDVNGNERNVFIFQLDFAGSTSKVHTSGAKSFIADTSPWNDPESIISTPNTEPRIVDSIELIEFKLQSRFGAWLTSQHIDFKQLRVSTTSSKGFLKPDFYLPNQGMLIEAKASSSRNYVRTAIGQILDYVHVAELAGMKCTPALLLPELPSNDLNDLIAKLNIGLIVENQNKFVFYNCQVV